MKNLTPIVIAVAVVILVAGILVTCHRCSHPASPSVASRDTVYLHTADVVAGDPIIVAMDGGRIPSEVRTVTNYRTLKDTVQHTDTIYVYDRDDVDGMLSDYAEVRHYSDTVAVKWGTAIIRNRVTANKLDSQTLTLNQAIPQITTNYKAKPKRWGIGVQAGYGIGKDFKPQPWVGVGVTRTLIRF